MAEGIVVAYQANISRDDGPGYVKFKCYKPVNVPKALQELGPKVLTKMYQGALRCFKDEYDANTTLQDYYTHIVNDFYLTDYKPLKNEESLSSREEATICFGEFNTCFYKPTRQRSGLPSFFPLYILVCVTVPNSSFKLMLCMVCFCLL